MLKHANIKIFGIVQGVSYRYYAARKAEELGLAGWIRNEKDGSVSLAVEGEEEGIYEFSQWCQEGSPAAKVRDIVFNINEKFEKFKGFEIRH